MARIYDVVCPNCGEILHWCKYDPPSAISPCPECGYELATEDGEDFKDDVRVFGVGSTNLDVLEFSERVKRERCDECEAFCLKPYRYPNCEIGELEKKREG